ncbi:MAG: [LysW]-aminoadipate kinase [Myxococcota bacterium]|nr:[LysW]-aminoadipate kinase [Myxococcota bacterium]
MLVVKIGGGSGIPFDGLADDIVALTKENQKIVVVHGGSFETNRLANSLGHPPEFIQSPSGHTSRRTDRRTLEILQMACCGNVNKNFVRMLQKKGVSAIGLSGLDGAIWTGTRKDTIRSVVNGRTRIIRDDYTGIVRAVNAPLLRLLIDNGYVPVISPPSLAKGGEAINVDGDRAAAATAIALGADELVILSNIPGLLRDLQNDESLIQSLSRHEWAKFDVYAKGRMRKKMLGAKEAIDGGVTRVVLSDARVENPLQNALAGIGTVIQ